MTNTFYNIPVETEQDAQLLLKSLEAIREMFEDEEQERIDHYIDVLCNAVYSKTVGQEKELTNKYLRLRYAEQIQQAEMFYDGFRYGRSYNRREWRYYGDCPYEEDSIESWAYWVMLTLEPDLCYMEEIAPDGWEVPGEYENLVLEEDKGKLIELLCDYAIEEHKTYRRHAEEEFGERWGIGFDEWVAQHPEFEERWGE